MCVCKRVFSESLPYCLCPSLVVESKGRHSTLPVSLNFTLFVCVCRCMYIFYKIHVHLYRLRTEFNCQQQSREVSNVSFSCNGNPEVSIQGCYGNSLLTEIGLPSTLCSDSASLQPHTYKRLLEHQPFIHHPICIPQRNKDNRCGKAKKKKRHVLRSLSFF